MPEGSSVGGGPPPASEQAFSRTVPGDSLTAEGAQAHYLRTQTTGFAPRQPTAEAGPPVLAGEALGERLRSHGLLSDQEPTSGTRYELHGMLGVGATGQVFAVRDRNLGREVAVKVLTTTAVADRSGVASFIDEARITASLTHPNVLPVYEIDITSQGQPYFTMGKVSGQTLGEAIQRSTDGHRDARIASTNALVSIIIGVGNALSYAHDHGLVHQDIKPDNILLGDFGEVLVLDWGSATQWPTTGTSKLYGTPIYMSPEQARREQSTPLSDVYCLGATLFHALLLRFPTWADDPETFWERKQRGEIDPPTSDELRAAPRALVEISLKAMAPQSAHRYPTMKELVRDLERYQAGFAVTALREGWRLSLLRWYRRNRRVFWISTAAVAMVSAIGTALVGEKLKERQDWSGPCNLDLVHATPENLSAEWDLMTKPAWGPGTWESVPFTDAQKFSYGGGSLDLICGNYALDLEWKRTISGDFKVEWDYTAIRTQQNLNCFIGDNRESGYTFHISSWGDTTFMVMTTGAEFRMVDMRVAERPFVMNHAYHFVMERKDRHAQLSIDGNKVLDFMDVEHELPQRFGLDCFTNQDLRIANLHVYQRPLPQRVSPLAVAAKLYQLGNFVEAERQYQEIASAYPGSDLAVNASFWLGMCALRLAHVDRGIALLESFEKGNPRHELVPFSLHARLVNAVESHDDEVERTLRTALAAFPGHPISCTVLRELGEERLELLKPKPVEDPSDDPYPPDIAERIVAAIAEIRQWSDRYRTPWQNNAFISAAGLRLIQLGRLDDAFASIPRGTHEYAQALYQAGQFDRELAEYPTNSWLHSAISNCSRSAEELFAGKGDEWNVTFKQYVRGEFEPLLANPDDALCVEILLGQRRWEDILRLYPETPRDDSADRSPRFLAMIALGRYDDVLAQAKHPRMRAMAEIAAGHIEQGLAEGRDHEEIRSLVGLRWREANDPRGVALLERVAAGPTDFTQQSTMFSHHLLAPMVQAIGGDRGAARDRIALVSKRYPIQYMQQLHKLADLVLGTIDDAAYLAQPVHYGTEARLVLGHALRAELEGDPRAALAAYQAFMAVPFNHLTREILEDAFVAWRIRALSL